MLSVIIVSYNVRFFLEQCIHSVLRAAGGLHVELIVVDNASSDGTVEQLAPFFPAVRWIVNSENLGFGKACNQGLAECRGSYVLFLNPDTLIPENALRSCMDYLERNPGVGALGVPMVDGRGCFLPESKRSFPAPLASFFKLSGLASFFPRSGYFNRYALGNRDATITQPVEVLAGAFLFCRRGALDATGGFDERFFLYGEDIDLSYRIQQAGLENHYFAGTCIIHFKGESMQGAETRHVRHFYEAMLLFVNKHYQATWNAGYRFLIRAAIFLRAGLSFAARISKPVLLPLTDAALLFLSLHFMRVCWIKFIRMGVDFHVPFIPYAILFTTALFVAAAGFMGLYDRVFRTKTVARSLLTGTLVSLAFYALLPEPLRFSRGVVLGGVLLGAMLCWLLRVALFSPFLRWLGYEPAVVTRIVVAEEKTFNETRQMLHNAGRQGILYPLQPGTSCSDLIALSRRTGAREIVFCIPDVSMESALDQIRQVSRRGLRFLFHAAGSSSMVGSQWPSVSGSAIGSVKQYRIAQPFQRTMKRAADIFVSVVLLLLSPLHFLLHSEPAALLKNAVTVLTGSATWVGYTAPVQSLPELRPAIVGHLVHGALPADASPDEWYALHYGWWQDIFASLRQYPKLGQAARTD